MEVICLSFLLTLTSILKSIHTKMHCRCILSIVQNTKKKKKLKKISCILDYTYLCIKTQLFDYNLSSSKLLYFYIAIIFYVIYSVMHKNEYI